MLTRLSHSHIRFGTFQRHAYLDRADLIGQLVDHAVETYYPELGNAAGQARRRCSRRWSAAPPSWSARWMAAGFVHGVLNTDNMNITGESFDYGPYRFLPRNDPNFVAAYFDETGLYAFGRQPEAVFWNLRQLAGALTLVDASRAAGRGAERLLGRLPRGAGGGDAAAAGPEPRGADADVDLVNAAFQALAEGGEALRWEPFFFDWFGGLGSEPRALAGPRAALYGGEAFADFRARLAALRDGAARAPGRAPISPGRAGGAALRRDRGDLGGDRRPRDDWGPFEAKLQRIEAARQAWGFAQPHVLATLDEPPRRGRAPAPAVWRGPEFPMRPSLLVAAVALSSIVACGSANAATMEVQNAWIRTPPPGAPTAAGYATITNHGIASDRLTGAYSSAAAERRAARDVHGRRRDAHAAGHGRPRRSAPPPP